MTLETAQRFLELRRPERVLEELARLDAEEATAPRAVALRASALIELGRDEESLDAVEGGLVDVPDDPELLFLLSVGRRLQWDLAGAEDALLRALATDPDDPELLSQYADLLMQGQQMGKAERVLDLAAANDAQDPGVLQGRQTLAYLKGRRREAGRLSREILALDPEEVRSHRMLGAIALDRNRFNTAAERLAEAVRLEPADDPTADRARTAGELQGGFYAPMRFFWRLGVLRSWAIFVLTYGYLRETGNDAAIYLLIGWWAVWGWCAFSLWVLSQRLD